MKKLKIKTVKISEFMDFEELSFYIYMDEKIAQANSNKKLQDQKTLKVCVCKN
jgi:hypothetical protein